MASIFTQIINREIPAHIVAETSDCIAFLDASPLAHGHVLVVPKVQVDYIFDLDDELYTRLQLFAKVVAQAIKQAFPCRKVGVAVVGLEVPHTHIHLIPINSVADINFSRPKLSLTQGELHDDAQKILQQLELLTRNA